MQFDNYSSLCLFTQQGLISTSYIPGPRTVFGAKVTMRTAVLAPTLMELSASPSRLDREPDICTATVQHSV